MKSSVRILAIALALAFLLLARTAFQEDTTASAAKIDLKDGEASFADLLDGTQEAKYLGFNEDDGKTAQVYFYIKSEDLGTQVTASTANVGVSGRIITLNPGTAVAGTVSTTSIATLLDGTSLYCSTDGATSTIAWTTAGVPTQGDPVVALPDGWALGPDVSAADVATCTTQRDPDNSDRGNAATTTDAAREMMLLAIQKAIHDPENKRTQDANGGLYTYGSDDDPYSDFNPGLRYTHGLNESMVGGETRPLASVKATEVTARGTDAEANMILPTFITNAEMNQFQSLAVDSPGTDIDVEFTFDIIDKYPASDKTAANMGYKAYSSGFGRAYVSSGSDSGQWVDITEVMGETNNAEGEDSPTSNLFQGVVTIVNDTSLETDEVIYAQDGDTITLTVVSEDGKRSSDVIATATALIDNSAPTISDLSPADDSVISDNTLRISFNVNDEGSGLDFREVDMKKVVTRVDAEPIGADGKGIKADRCELTSEDDDIDNAGGNASRVGVLISPGGTNTFSSRCPQVVNTTANSANSDGEKFNLVITSQDLAGNLAEHTTQLTIDTDEPTVTGNPGAGQGWNADKNDLKASQNSILIKFNESLDVDTVSVSDFTVAGYTIDTAEVVGTNDDAEDDPDMKKQHLNEYVVLTLTEDLTKNARPSVTVTGVSDVAGNAIDTTTRTSDNKIKPAVTVVPFAALIAKDGEQAISFTSDEALRKTSGVKSTEASVNGSTLAITVADDTMGGNATFKQKTFDDSRSYGVMIRAVDVDDNDTSVGAMSVDDEDFDLTAAVLDGAGREFDVKLANWPPADTNFDGNFGGEVEAYVGKTMIAESGDGNDVVDWDAGTVTLTTNSDAGALAKGDTVTLKYSYVDGDQVIQVDVGAPTLTSKPGDGDETDYASGAIQFTWTEDNEYAGDSYKTVTLNSAMHEANGTSTDILSKLTTNDNKTWTFHPAADLALGDHEFTLKATDAAGNSATETVTITVIERKPVKINFGPGWNLISLRGAPASNDVNDIFGGDSGVNVVSQYDGRRVSPWTVWTRGEDGMFMSAPAGRSNIDPGLGLYVNSDGTPLEVDIPGTSRDNPTVLPPSIDLIPGWNLIAVIILDRDTKSVSVDDYLPAETWSRAFKLDNDTGVLVSISPKTGDDEGAMVDAGQALWVYATKAGVVTPSK